MPGFSGSTGLKTTLRGMALAALLATAASAEEPRAMDRSVDLRGLAGPARVAPVRRGDDSGLAIEKLERRWESALRVREELGPHGMSRKGMARRDRRIRQLLRRAAPEPDTLRVLLVRIAFRSDRSGSLTSVTEDGNFLLEPDSTVFFDPPPHDRKYFEAHARALSEYWSSMSNGQIVAETTVLPPGNEDAYFLEDLADYGPGSGGFWTIERLERLVRDMIGAADQGTLADGSANLADYDFDDPDTYIIFAHSGADLQSNLVWTPGQPGYSPNDIPTFFVTLGDSAVVDLQSVDPDTGEPGRVTECSVIPETTSQDGLVGAITAALLHEFGHALGLPDLYSTTTGYPTIGFWGIMDSGTNVAVNVAYPDPADPGSFPDRYLEADVVGLLPPSASIWSKWYLGFVDEKRVGASETTTDLAASWRQDTREKALRIDVSANEFFLVENRWVPPVGRPEWGLTADPETGVVLFLGEYEEVAPGDFQLVGNSHLYDYALPFLGGTMIWRIRQDRVEEGMEFNTVQGTPTRLGVELVEADGIKDIGVADFATRGFLGSDSDAFRSPSTYAYDGGTLSLPGTRTDFGPDTVPPSRSSFRIPTGVSLTGIGPTGDRSTTMTSRIDGPLHSPTSGYPVELPVLADPSGYPVVTGGAPASLSQVEAGGRSAVLVAGAPVDSTQPPGLYAYDREGQPFLATARVADLAGPPAGSPVVSDRPAPASVICVAADGRVQVFDAQADFAEYLSVTLDSVDTQPLVLEQGTDPWIFAARRAPAAAFATPLADPAVAPVSFDFADAARLQADPVALTALGADAVALLVDGRVDLRRPDGQPVDDSLWPVDLPAGAQPDSVAWLAAWPAPDGGDTDALIVADDRGRLARVELVDGRVEVHVLGDGAGGSPVGELVLADVDGDGALDIVLATADRVWAFNAFGTPLRGFPVPLDGLLIVLENEEDRFVTAPVVADLDGDGLNEIALTTHYGITHVLGERGQAEDGFPRAFSSAGAPLAVLDLAGTSGPTRALFAFSALGDSLGSGRRARPGRIAALDLGPAPAAAGGDRPAEWTVRGGSMARSGRANAGSAASGAPDPAAGLDTVMMIPNPIGVTDDQAFVRYFSGGVHTATITLYTLEGEEAGRWSHRVDAVGAVVQLAWSPRGLASGPYLCRVDYLGRDGRTTDLETVYVER